MMSVNVSCLQGKRVLIVEDEMLVALMIEDILIELGCSTLGPHGNVAMAIKAARTEDLEMAVLDVNLAGEMVYPVADVLEERRIPFLFVSGYGDGAIPADKTSWKVCTKPFKVKELIDMLAGLLDPALH